jgi:galactokinase
MTAGASTLHDLRENVARAARREFGQAPKLWVAAPGRVNLIGEHTDYNDGFVLPAAIDRHVVLGATPRADRLVRLHAVDFVETVTFDLDAIAYSDRNRWSNYLRGVAWALQGAGYRLQGMDAVLSSDVPVASGLSSSAAIEVATAFAFQVLSEFDLDGVQRALLCQKAENQFVGMNCGIMDQFIVSLGERNHALLIDCRTLDYQPVPIPAGCGLVICNTKKKRGLVDSEYNTRRQECERGAAILRVKALRDASSELLAQHRDRLDAVTYRRCRHVISEDERTLMAVEALRRGSLERLGELMADSHVSLRDDYEVSCYELDVMVEAAWQQSGVIGARMTGAGFGGCTINLVREGHAEAFARSVAREYSQVTGITPEVYICRAEDGVRPLG